MTTSGPELTSVAMGRAIGQAITDDGMTQSEFARRVGCSEKHLSRVITGLDTASGAMLDYWAFALGRRWTVKLEEADTR